MTNSDSEKQQNDFQRAGETARSKITNPRL